MFTGIVEGVAVIEARSGSRLIIQPPKDWRVRAGESVAVAGVCLTVSKIARGQLRFDVMSETRRKTTLGKKKVGDKVNFERALKVGDEIGGHFVYGHVDGVGAILSPPHTRRGALGQSLGAGWWIKIKPPSNLMRYIVPQGSVALDGVSLTVARVGENNFTVSLVPYTLKHTTLGTLEKGDLVNIEVDMMVKYIERIREN